MILASFLAACAPSRAAGPGLPNETTLAAPTATVTAVATHVPAATLIPTATLAGASSPIPPTFTPGPLPTAGPMPGRVDPSPAPQTGEAPDEVVQVAVQAALASAALPDGSAVTVVRAEAVLWPDGSLGCPRPGVMYIQTEVPGYWVEIEVADQHFDYRFSDAGTPILCTR